MTLAMSALMSSGIGVVYGLALAAAKVPPCNFAPSLCFAHGYLPPAIIGA
jgi:hypothetical protein